MNIVTARILLLGAGHAHLAILKNLDKFILKGHSVTVVSPSEFHYYSGMGPGLLAGIYSPEEVRFTVKEMTEKAGGVFVTGRVVSLDPEAKRVNLDNGKTLSFDLASMNVGSVVPDIHIGEGDNHIFTVKPIENFMEIRQEVLGRRRRGPVRLLVLGGGAAGVETAAAFWRVCADNDIENELTLVSGSGLLERFSTGVRRSARRSLLERHIKVIEGALVRGIQDSRAVMESGEILPFDIAVNAMGTRPPGFIIESGLECGSTGGLLVDRYLRYVNCDSFFGGGDCIDFGPAPLQRIGVFAVRQGPVLLRNLLALAEGDVLSEFVPQRNHLGILNMGDNRGVLFRGCFSLSSRLAFILKDRIDRSFMKRFRVNVRET